jgi:hypothetical protein
MFLQIASYGLILFGVFIVLMICFTVFWAIFVSIFGDPFERLKAKLGIETIDTEESEEL